MKNDRSSLKPRLRLRYIAVNTGWVLIGVYGAITTCWFILVLLGVREWPVVEMLSNLLPMLLIPVLAVLPICLLFRRWRLALTATPALLALLFGYGILFTPRAAQTLADGPSWRLLTYNLYAESFNMQPKIEVIREANADVVALQELSPVMAKAVRTQLAAEYPYQALHTNEDEPLLGQGVLSRYPIVEDEYWHISLGHQRVKIDYPGTPIVLYNVHPAHPFHLEEGVWFDMQPHRIEVDEMLRRAAHDRGAIVIAGDFNMTDQAYDYERLIQHFGDTYREVGWGMGFTFPDFSPPYALPIAAPALATLVRPVARIDFIFHSDDLQPIAARVWPTSGGSDHRPLLAEFAHDSSQATAARP